MDPIRPGELNLVEETVGLLKDTAWEQLLEQYLPKEDSYYCRPLIHKTSWSEKDWREDQTTEGLQWKLENSAYHNTCGIPIGLEVRFTREEMNSLATLKETHQRNNKLIMKNDLFAAIVAHFLGTLSIEAMLHVFSSGRKAQNFYHYLTITSTPFFDSLTTNTQRKLMMHKTEVCFSLNIALFFFGHRAVTAVQQEEMTGLETGLKEYLMVHNPDLMETLPPTRYDEVFIVPWATSRDVEVTHRELMQSVGATIRGLDHHGYLLLYGLCLYSIEPDALAAMDLPKQDREVLQKAVSYFSVMYRRYLKHMVGWKRALELQMNQRHVLDQLQQAVNISSKKNLNCNDLSDTRSLNAISGHH